VLCAHDPDSHGFGLLSTRRGHQVGWAGVDLFFAISGLLICSRLLEEEQLNGKISLRDFYVRRVFRILPAAYAFLAVALFLGLLHQVPYSIPATLAAVLMVRNYWGAFSGVLPNELYTDHFWSLSVEEHFYLLLPGILVFVKRRTLLLLFLTGISYAWFTRFVLYGQITNGLVLSRTDLRIHGLLFPAVLAIALSQPYWRAVGKKWLRPWFWIGLICILATAIHKVAGPVRITIVSLCFPFMVASTMIHPTSIACRILEWKPIRFVGRLSYGIYLWQQLFVLRPDSTAWPISLMQRFPWNYIGLMACALTSYYLLERPLIKVGHRLAPPATPGRLDITPEMPELPPAIAVAEPELSDGLEPAN
jgi:peptidoglycan/LPS O-acetylase OafA/YrhL